LDLNGFKSINDNYGHAVGDQLLQSIAVRFTRAVGDSTMVARLGGDEFGLITFGPESHAAEIAQALHAALSYPISLATIVVEVGVSIGHALSAGSAPVDADRVSAIRKAIANGSYPLIPTKISDAMIAAGLTLRIRK